MSEYHSHDFIVASPYNSPSLYNHLVIPTTLNLIQTTTVIRELLDRTEADQD